MEKGATARSAHRRVRMRVQGVVQGVGFRPRVYGLATGHGLGGFIGNDGAGVFIAVEGAPRDVDDFVTAVRSQAPPLAVIERVDVDEVEATGETGFRIVESVAGVRREALVSPDRATCLAEIGDPGARRYRYPFTNCTDCGPRYTIVRDVPYDRAATTMAGFAMCADCARASTATRPTGGSTPNRSAAPRAVRACASGTPAAPGWTAIRWR